MKFKIPFEDGGDEINMAPMIDMVFLLLIFFMVASHLTELERVPVLLPVADKAKVPEVARERQVVSILAEDDSGAKVKIFVNMQEMDLKQFGETLQLLTVQHENLQLYLRADRRVLHRHIQSVMKSCAEAGIADITFGTFESGN